MNEETEKLQKGLKISRWIYVPLGNSVFFATLNAICRLIIDLPFTFYTVLSWLFAGALMGFLFLYLAQRKGRSFSKNNDESTLDVEQNRTLVALLNYEKTFQVCREAILSLGEGTVKTEDFQKGEIHGLSRISRNSARQKSEIRLKKINENLIEIEVFVRPVRKGIVVASGFSWKTAEDICEFIKKQDAEINKKVLVASTAVLDDVYVKPFQKEKVRQN